MSETPTANAENTAEFEDMVAALRSHGVKILGDIISPTVPYEDYTFDENNVCPEAWAARQSASKKQDRESH